MIKFRITKNRTYGSVKLSCNFGGCEWSKDYVSLPVPKQDMFDHAEDVHTLKVTKAEVTGEVICLPMTFITVS